MNKTLKEISLLVVLPLVLMSMSLAAIGTTHVTKFTQVNRIVKQRMPEDISVPCSDDLCQDTTSLENT